MRFYIKVIWKITDCATRVITYLAIPVLLLGLFQIKNYYVIQNNQCCAELAISNVEVQLEKRLICGRMLSDDELDKHDQCMVESSEKLFRIITGILIFSALFQFTVYCIKRYKNKMKE